MFEHKKGVRKPHQNTKRERLIALGDEGIEETLCIHSIDRPISVAILLTTTGAL